VMAITKMRFYRAARTAMADFAAVGSKTGFALKRASRTGGPPETSGIARHSLIVSLGG
jgi:hypothetical protein